MSQPSRIKELLLHTTQGEAARLYRESQFVVRYHGSALQRPDLGISLTMPPRPEGWRSNQIPPVLAMNLPEGFLLHRVIQRYQKAMDLDDMNLLAITSTPAAGRVWASTLEGAAGALSEPIALRDILAHRGTEALFDELLEKYSVSISGVQPKVVVPERLPTDTASMTPRDTHSEITEKSSIKSPDLIVKAAGAEFPGLAENEYICMSIARHAGLNTPEFWLSDDRKLFVIRRFDLSPAGYMGFEDAAVLTGKHPSRKYEGSYRDIARAISDFAAPAHRHASLDAFFRLMVVNCLIRNGDAHLKNFGILYGDPSTADQDARIAPVYDLVCSVVYLPKDVLALSIGGSKAWPDRKTLVRFGKDACGLKNPLMIIDELIEQVAGYQHEDPDSAMWKRIEVQLQVGLSTIQSPGKFASSG